MAIAADFEIQNDADIRYTGVAHAGSGAGYYTVIEFHRWLQDLADDASAAGDDFMDITKSTPSDRSTDNIITLLNGYNIDQTASEHLYGGSIIQSSGAEIFDGILVYANAGMDLQIHQDGAIIASDFWNSVPFGTGLKGLNPDSANGISHRFLLKVRTTGADIDGRRIVTQTRVWGKTYSEFKINGTSRGNNVAALTYANDLNNQTLIGTIAALTNITNTEGYRGIDVDNDTANEYYYSEWNLDGEAVNDFYERLKWLSRQESASTLYGLTGELFRGITHEVTVDGPSGTFSAVEAINWGIELASVTISGTGGQFACTSTAPFAISVGQKLIISGTYGGTGSITGYSDPTTYLVSATNGTTTFTLTTTAGVAIVTTAGTPTGLTYKLRSGTGQMLAINSTTAATKLWMQLLTGVAPIDNQKIYGVSSSAYCFMNVTVTERTLSYPFVGVSTGTSIIGSYGLGIEALDLQATDKVFDLTNTQYQAPNYVTFTVSNLVAGDRVLVTNDDGTAIDLNQMTLDGALSGGAVTAVVVNGAIPADTPATGTIRILRASGFYTRHPYSAWTGSTFTITSHNFSTDNAANGANTYVSYIDDVAAGATMTFTAIYDADRTLYVRVRNGGGSPKIKTYETTATLGSAGGSASTSRISDE